MERGRGPKRHGVEPRTWHNHHPRHPRRARPGRGNDNRSSGRLLHRSCRRCRRCKIGVTVQGPGAERVRSLWRLSCCCPRRSARAPLHKPHKIRASADETGTGARGSNIWRCLPRRHLPRRRLPRRRLPRVSQARRRHGSWRGEHLVPECYQFQVLLPQPQQQLLLPCLAHQLLWLRRGEQLDPECSQFQVLLPQPQQPLMLLCLAHQLRIHHPLMFQLRIAQLRRKTSCHLVSGPAAAAAAVPAATAGAAVAAGAVPGSIAAVATSLDVGGIAELVAEPFAGELRHGGWTSRTSSSHRQPQFVAEPFAGEFRHGGRTSRTKSSHRRIREYKRLLHPN
mmetsp:Transcript_969/g.3885  ORF Transcript_969/g.3885 Transcript_969/m.3885 type:complete len:338 (+) Transcript_969:728-1741(+)